MKAINAIIVLSLQKSKQAPKGTGAKLHVCPARFVSEYWGKVVGCLGGVGACARSGHKVTKPGSGRPTEPSKVAFCKFCAQAGFYC